MKISAAERHEPLLLAVQPAVVTGLEAPVAGNPPPIIVEGRIRAGAETPDGDIVGTARPCPALGLGSRAVVSLSPDLGPVIAAATPATTPAAIVIGRAPAPVVTATSAPVVAATVIASATAPVITASIIAAPATPAVTTAIIAATTTPAVTTSVVATTVVTSAASTAPVIVAIPAPCHGRRQGRIGDHGRNARRQRHQDRTEHQKA